MNILPVNLLKALLPLSVLVLSACGPKSDPEPEQSERQVISVVPDQTEETEREPTIVTKTDVSGDGAPLSGETERINPETTPEKTPEKTKAAKADGGPESEGGEPAGSGATNPTETTAAPQEPAVKVATAEGEGAGSGESSSMATTASAGETAAEVATADTAPEQTEEVASATTDGAPEQTEKVEVAGEAAPPGDGKSGASADADTQSAGEGEAEGAASGEFVQPSPSAGAESDAGGAADGGSESGDDSQTKETAPMPAGEKTDESGGGDHIKQLKSTGVISGDYDERLNYYTVAYLVHYLGQAHKMLKYLMKESSPFSESVKTEIINLISSFCYDAHCRRIDFSRLDREKAARFIGYTGILMASDADDINVYHSGWSGPDSRESGATTDAGVSAARAMLSESPYLIPDPREKPALVPAAVQGSFEPLAVLHSSTVNSQNPLHARQFIESMKGRRIKALAINLPSLRAAPSDHFFALGEFIKKEGVGLHIIGTCAAGCAHYLLPAAHYVHIGPYGHISLYGSAGGFRRDIQSVLPLQAAFIESGRTESAVPALFNQIVNSLKVQAATGIPAGSGPNFDLFQHELHETLKIAQKTIPGAAEHPERVLLNVLINRWGQAPGNDGAAIVRAFQRSAESRGLNHILEAEPGLYREIFAALSPHELKTLKKFVFDASHAARRQQGYVQALAAGEAAESGYFQKINAPGLFVSLLDLTSGLIRNDYYLNGFFTPRFFFNIPEEEKPWVKTVPSADMLRHVGLKDVRGENHAEMFAPFGLSKDPEGTGLALNPENIERCNFLTSEGAADFRSWNEEDLNNCLFAN